MKITFRFYQRRGMALVLVMMFLILITTLIVSFFSSVTSELSEAKSYANAASSRQLSDSAVQMVMSTMKLALSNTSSNVAWASQPGMLRTYNDEGRPLAFYKLYSSDHTIIEAGQTGAFNPADDLKVTPGSAVTDWVNQPAIFTDLNSPVTTTTGTSYPIIDPRARGSVEGFDLSAGADSPAASTPNANTAPMPVKWIYILKDGTLTTPTGIDATGKIANWTGSAATPTAANPITGRIAFWTDDETCKINVNTASEGTFWDTPRFEGTSERSLARNQFAHNEFQRYPGHPATVSLSTALKGFIPGITPETIYGMAPRITEGGSRQGTQVPSGSMDPDSDRLYASVDEFVFNPSRSSQTLTAEHLEKLRFFLTARSSAPELTLFGTPRVSIWPIYNNIAATTGTEYATAFDRLAARCASLSGTNAYYFQREDSTSPTTDINLSRNKDLLNYLDTLANRNIPGFGGNFRTKYGTDETHQILTEMFDFTRATNSRETSVSNPYADPKPTASGTTVVAGRGQVTPSHHINWDTQGFGRFYRLAEVAIWFTGVGRGKYVQYKLDPPVTGSAANAVNILPLQIPKDVSREVPDDNMAVQAYIICSFFDPAKGWTKIDQNFTLEITGLDEFKLNDKLMSFPLGSNYLASDDWMGYRYGTDSGGYLDFRVMTSYNRALTTKAAKGPRDQFPFFSTILNVPLVKAGDTSNPSPAPTMYFQGGPITIKIYQGNAAPNLSNLVATYNIDFFTNKNAIPVPGLASNRLLGTGTTGLGDRFNTAAEPETRDTIEKGDVVQSYVLASGDYRQLARPTINSSDFIRHPLSLNSRLAHSFVFSDGSSFNATPAGKNLGKLVKNAAYSGTAMPIIPQGINGVPAPGDWDTGPAHRQDGPFINKPDDGNITKIDVGTSNPPYFASSVFEAASGNYSSPNRQLASPIAYGSLPTGVISRTPWQTLLFRPDASGHKGATAPKDHLWADLFWMPVVEPYAISDPSSTSGKINMNYQIIPYTYITRNTALRAAMKPEKMAALPVSAASTYKTGTNASLARYDLNLDETRGSLRQFKERFASGDIFRSATEICNIWLVPSNQSWSSDADASNFWSNNTLTGDNLRERPYNNIYAKLTTKSNTYTVHYRVQSLKKVPGTNATQWVDNKDKITGEYRGSSVIERYLDPNEPNLPDPANPATVANFPSLESHYKYRIIDAKRFAP